MTNKLTGKVLVFGFTFISSLIFSNQVKASGGCVPVYGGGVECPRAGQVLIDKKVLNPATNQFVDNLTPADPKYRPEQIVTFRLIVKNSGDQTLDTISVNDNIPQFVDFMSGPGSFDANTRVLTFTVNNLTAGASSQFDLKARVVHPAVLPAEKNIICPLNVATAATGELSDRDESQFCIEKQMAVPQVPSAGPEEWMLTFVGLATAFIAGKFLRNKALI